MIPVFGWLVVCLFLFRLDEGDEGGIVAAVHVSVTGHSSDLTVLVATGGGGGWQCWCEDVVVVKDGVDEVAILDVARLDLQG